MRSDVVKKGVAKAPHRSLFKASGLTDEEINKPLIGIVTVSYTHLDVYKRQSNNKSRIKF